MGTLEIGRKYKLNDKYICECDEKDGEDRFLVGDTVVVTEIKENALKNGNFALCVKDNDYVSDWTYDDYIENGLTDNDITLVYIYELDEIE